VSGNYTFLDAREGGSLFEVGGKQLPFRPQHDGYVRFDLSEVLWKGLSLWVDATFTSSNALDAANLRRAPPRRLYGAGMKLAFWYRLFLGIDVRNFTDQRVEQEHLSSPPRPGLTHVPHAISDFAGYPLPGRAFYVTLEWEPSL
jgi:hypothetical protein